MRTRWKNWKNNKRPKFHKWFKYGLKAAQKLLAQGNASKQHALKGQKLLAQDYGTSSTP